MKWPLVAAALTMGCGASIQSPQCAAYVACTEATGTGNALIRGTYGDAGTCWTADKAMTDLCTSTCQSGLDQLRAAHPNAGC